MYNNNTIFHNAAYYHLANPTDRFSGYQHPDAATPDMAYPVAILSHTDRLGADRPWLPAPERGPHLASLASSIAGDSPFTPNISDADHGDRNGRAYGNSYKRISRTMTYIYGDRLYSPDFIITSSPGHSHGTDAGNRLFSQRLSAANSQHLNATHSPSSTASRGLSPFQATSPYAPPQLHDFGNSFGAATQRMGHSGQHGQQQAALMGNQTTGDAGPETPKTISPSDAMISLDQLPSSQGPSDQSSYTHMPMDNSIQTQAINVTTPLLILGPLGSSGSEVQTEATGNQPSRVRADSGANTHRCDRINPSTGKPCSTTFSRTYDLTRHEDTIHNERKQKIPCDLCTIEKTFSRADALTRHYRVCHPEAELPGKHRRRVV